MNENDNITGLEVEEAQSAYDIRYSYTDYLKWDDGVRRELIDGKIYLMAGPNWRHQKVSGNLYEQFKAFLKGKECEVYYAPLDVRLNADTLDNTVVQPDLMIICDNSILDEESIKGAPDMVVEILSPSTADYDRTTKFNMYLQAGIKEYWIVDPVTQSLVVNILANNRYITHVYVNKETVPVHILEGCVIDLSEVF